jgi:hypothetical protein
MSSNFTFKVFFINDSLFFLKDNLTYCKEKTTCCLTSDNKYGCCPIENVNLILTVEIHKFL